MKKEDNISELEALQRFKDKADELEKELQAFPGGAANAIMDLYKEMQPTAEAEYNMECTIAAWYRERDGEPPLAADEQLLKKLRSDIPDADEIIRIANHRAMLNMILRGSRQGWSVTDLCNLLDAGEDPDAFHRELNRIITNRKLPN